MTSVLIADDHPLYRQALARAVEDQEGLELVGQAESGADALSMIERSAPDVAVLDVKMPGLDGLAVLAEVQRRKLSTRVMLLSGYVDSDTVYEAVAAGCRAFFSKLTEADQICQAITRVDNGETVLPPEAQSTIAEQIRRRAASERPALTEREHQILELTAAGQSGPQIAESLHVSPGTVKTHLRHIYEKFGVSDRAAAVAEAMRRGVLGGGPSG